MIDESGSSAAPYTTWDNELIHKERRFDRAFFEAYLGNFQQHPQIETVAGWKTRSMLAVESLLLMRALAIEAQGAILEIGAYIGGGTLALADGARASGGKPLVTIDIGGAYDHPTMPSKDILADWRETLDSFGYSGASQLVVGWAFVPEIVQQALTGWPVR